MKKTPNDSNIYHSIQSKTAGYLFLLLVLLLILFFGLSFLNALFTSLSGSNDEFSNISTELEFKETPIQAGKLNEVVITLKDFSQEPFSKIVSSQGHFIHTFFTSEDLVMFGHDHPDAYQRVDASTINKGIFTLPVLFPKAGKYSVAIKYLTKNNNEIVALKTVDVVNENGSVPTAQSQTKDLRSTKNFDDYIVTFSTNPKTIKTCNTISLQYKLEKDGKPVTDFGTVDNTQLAVAAWTEDLSRFISAPGIRAAQKNASMLTASVIFSHPGTYQVFSEFEHDDKVIPSSFYVDVAGEKCL